MTTKPILCQTLGHKTFHDIAHEKCCIFYALVFSVLFHGVLFYFFGSGFGQSASTPGTQMPSISRLQLVSFNAAEVQLAFSSMQTDQQERPPVDTSSSTKNPDALATPKNTLSIKTNSFPNPERSDRNTTSFEPPVFAVAIEPHYPLHLLANGTRGSVSVTFQFDNNGKIADLEIIESQPSGAFDQSVINAVLAARLQQSGVRPSGRFMITVIFDPAGTSIQPKLFQEQ